VGSYFIYSFKMYFDYRMLHYLTCTVSDNSAVILSTVTVFLSLVACKIFSITGFEQFNYGFAAIFIFPVIRALKELLPFVSFLTKTVLIRTLVQEPSPALLRLSWNTLFHILPCEQKCSWTSVFSIPTEQIQDSR
jgi:hypothetical protein